MRTLVFCTSYADQLWKWKDRWAVWLRGVKLFGLQADQILIVDDGSPVLPEWTDVCLVKEGEPIGVDGVVLYHFQNRLGQHVNGEPFPGWYRSFAFAVNYGIHSGFDKIIHIEADAFLVSGRAADYFNSVRNGWISMWCPTHGWAESTLQIINKDQFANCLAFFSKPYSAHVVQPYTAIERLLPVTYINETLVGDRYGEGNREVPYGADFASQLGWSLPESYYWWLEEKKDMNILNEIRPTLAELNNVYSDDDQVALAHMGVDYRQFLKFLNDQLCPSVYFEIGTHQGDSVRMITCSSICVDPRFMLTGDVIGNKPSAQFYQITSDDFFEKHELLKISGSPDLVFLDGLHLFEALLKDFINTEKHVHQNSVILLHDCMPLNNRMAGRVHEVGPETEAAETRSFWTGDVWRVIPILHMIRPDLKIIYVDCPPTGLVLISNLNPRSEELIYSYERMVATFRDVSLEAFGLEKLWNLFPRYSSHKIIAEPQLFCRSFGLRAEQPSVF